MGSPFILYAVCPQEKNLSEWKLELYYIKYVCISGWPVLMNGLMNAIFFLECPKHCSMCYNETECYECVPGYFLNGLMECESRSNS